MEMMIFICKNAGRDIKIYTNKFSIGASEKVEGLFERFREEYPIYQERYKDGLITGEELMDWLECMKIRK